MSTKAHLLDRLSRTWMSASSRRVPRDSVTWLLGPIAGADVVGHGWVERVAAELGGSTSRGPEHGLLPSFSALSGPTFDPAKVDPRIVDFYEHTAAWTLDLWSEWSALAWPFGRAITALWSRRLQQLSLPMRPLDVSRGMDSDVVHIHDAAGVVFGAGWLRTMRKTGETTYSGQYGVARVPECAQPCVRVVFPLPYGSLPVFLTPAADPDGSFHLHSRTGPFGAEGAYLVLDRFDGTVNVRRIPVVEHFHVYVDTDGELRCDHDLRLGRIPAVRLHYRMRRAA
jgi:hypothetical protein